MGQVSHAVTGLDQPFHSIAKDIFTIPRGGCLRLGSPPYKLVFILEGRVEHEIDGLQGRMTLEPGDIIVAPLVKEQIYINSNDTRAASIHAIRLYLDEKCLKKRMRHPLRQPESCLADYILHHLSTPARIQGGINARMMDSLYACMEEAERRESGYLHRVHSICTDLIIETARKMEPSHVQVTASSPLVYLVAPAREYIQKHLSADITLDEIARHLGKSEEHLARIFKQQTGQSVFEYIRESRIHHAKVLLADPSLSLTQIARKCGFKSLAFFSRSFHRDTHFSPSEYRKHTWVEERTTSS